MYVPLLAAVGCRDTYSDVISWDEDPIHGYRYGMNGDNQIIERHSIDPDGDPAADTCGVWITRFVRDDMDSALEEAYFDLDSNPVVCFGVHLIRSEFDGQGRRTCMELYDTDGELIGPDRVAVHQYEYDDTENSMTWSTYDSHGTCTLPTDPLPFTEPSTTGATETLNMLITIRTENPPRIHGVPMSCSYRMITTTIRWK
jgi:hypothetical protein